MRLSSLTLALTLTACGGTLEHERAPAALFEQQQLLNGKRHALRFDSEVWQLDRIAVGAWLDFSVPRIPVVGHTIGHERWTAGARFTFTADPGLELTAAPSSSEVQAAQVRCAAAGTFTVHFKAVDADGTATEDAIDLGCIQATRLAIDFGEGEQPLPARYQLGGTIWVVANLFAGGPDGSELALVGNSAVTVAPGSESLVAQVPSGSASANLATLVALRLGERPSVIAAGLTQQLPLQIVDARDWSPALAVTRVNGGSVDYPSLYLQVQTRLVLPDGGELFGLHSSCSFTSFLGSAPTVESSGGACGLYGTPDSTLYAADRVCVTTLGRSACAAVPH